MKAWRVWRVRYFSHTFLQKCKVLILLFQKAGNCIELNLVMIHVPVEKQVCKNRLMVPEAQKLNQAIGAAAGHYVKRNNYLKKMLIVAYDVRNRITHTESKPTC